MKIIYFLSVLIVTVTFSNFGLSQMSGISAYAGTGWWEQSTGAYYNGKAVHFGLSYEKLISRNLNAKLRGNYNKVGFTYETIGTGNFNLLNSYELGVDLNYWYLNDIRLINKMARQSCKGMLVVLNTRVKSYLSGGILYRSISDSPSGINQNSWFMRLGLGYHLWRFKVGKFSRFTDPTSVTSSVIPFFEASYLLPLGENVSAPFAQKLGGVLLSFEIKYGFL